MGWLLVLGLKEGLVKCATVCIKSWVVLTTLSHCLVKLCRDTILLLKVNHNPYSAALPHLPFLSSVFSSLLCSQFYYYVVVLTQMIGL